MARPPLPTPPAESSPIATASSAPSAAPVGLALHAAVEQVRRLITKDCAPLEFFDKLLALLTADHPAAIGAIWMAGTKQQNAMGLLTHLRFLETGVMNDRRTSVSCQHLLIDGWQAEGPLTRRHTLGVTIPFPFTALIPIRDSGKKIGLIQLFTDEEIDFEEPEIVSAVTELIDLVERFLRRAGQAEKVSDHGAFFPEFEAFVRRLHSSLDPAETMLTAAHELRPLVHCDRVTFLDYRRRKPVLAAASGQKTVNSRSRQVQLLQSLALGVVRTGRRFQFTGEGDELPGDISRTLAEYIEASSAQVILIEPVFATSPAGKNGKPSTAPRKILGAIAFEYFTESLPHPALAARLAPCLEQVSLALENARRHRRLTMVPGFQTAGFLAEFLRGSRLMWVVLAVASLAWTMWFLATSEIPLPIECRGHLMPVVRRDVYAALDGEVAEVLVRESQAVQAGDVLVRMQSTPIEDSIRERSSQLEEKLKRVDATRAELRTALAGQSREQPARLQAQMAVLSQEIKTLREQLVVDEAEREKLVVKAPIAGTVTTSDPVKTLMGRPVQRGETLLTVMDETGPWHVEMSVPEKRAGHLLTWAAEHPEIAVEYRAVARPEQTHPGRIERIGDRSVVTPELGTAVPVYGTMETETLPLRRIGMEVNARLECAPRSRLFVYFGEFQEYLQRNWWIE